MSQMISLSMKESTVNPIKETSLFVNSLSLRSQHIKGYFKFAMFACLEQSDASKIIFFAVASQLSTAPSAIECDLSLTACHDLHCKHLSRPFKETTDTNNVFFPMIV